MKQTLKKCLKSILFSAGGALAGLAYYDFIGCADNTCPLTSSPWITMAYMGVAGWLVSVVCGREC